jgi:DNA-binding response OmpR family regulator
MYGSGPTVPQPVHSIFVSMLAAPRINILAVDDDEAMRELLRLHLSNAGYVVTVAEDAIAAGHRMLRLPPDLVILDVDLPFLNDLDFASALLADATVTQVPVIFISAHEEFASRAERLGGDFIVKPFRRELLLASVAKHLRR